MAEESKYYVPAIEEFYVGFEFEVQSSTGNWVTTAMGNLKMLEEIIDTIKNKNIRVKYLDEEDIESFGFKQITDECFNLGIKSYRGRDQQEVRILIRKTVLIYLAQDEKYNDEKPVTLFTGVIKNKSELKKLLIQLEVI